MNGFLFLAIYKFRMMDLEIQKSKVMNLEFYKLKIMKPKKGKDKIYQSLHLWLLESLKGKNTIHKDWSKT